MAQGQVDKEVTEEQWRLRLGEAERRYKENRTPASRAEFRAALAIFAALVMRGVLPNESCDQMRHTLNEVQEHSGADDLSHLE